VDEPWNDFWHNFGRGMDDGLQTWPVAPADRPLVVAAVVIITLILLVLALVLRRRFVK